MASAFKYWPYFPLLVASSACSMWPFEQTARLCADPNGEFHECPSGMAVEQNSIISSKTATLSRHFVLINEYTQQIAQELKTDLPIYGLDGAIVVTPFVYRNSPIEQAEELGQDLANYLSNDLRDLGIVTSDTSLVPLFYRTEQGAIEFSALQQDVFDDLDSAYVLAGNLLRTHQGIMINSKIIELKSGKLIASNAKLLPNLLLNNL
ncbi:FlgO family outer membrane protein [uncultured Paraglaciecola sp.]|uniref:FlgO family outer membrane protein n=1 Tax=uncultured Paraglaciecola sp. TaxID=1765024 RepID=UPI0025EB92AD|nr:FlgO family outer membrane protein [uncultured Paraglaciecola sp.]